MSVLKVAGITQAFFTEREVKVVLEDVSFELAEGELVAFLGPSGCGKSTLLSIICGMLQPTMGKVEFGQQVVIEPDGQIGYMLQHDYLYPWLTIEENIFLGLRIGKCLTEENKQYVWDLLDAVGLKETRKQMPGELSGGMRQRVALVRTMATRPKLLLLDEPFSALDYQTKLKLEAMVFHLLKALKEPAILVTHDIEEAIATCDRIMLLRRNPGYIVKQFLVPEEIRNAHPLEARGLQSFHAMFHEIWKEMEKLGT